MRDRGMLARIERRMGRSISLGPAAARREMMHLMQRLVLLSLAITLLILGGAFALSAFEHTSYWQGVVWALDTVATVGSIPHPDTLGGQVTTVALITLGIGTMFYVLVTLSELFVAGELSGLLESRRMQRKISHFTDHFLICGFGRVGRQIARDFDAAGVPFVVIDENPEVQEAIEEMQVPHVEGRASDDGVLVEAGIERARAVIACIDSDAENIFATLTARQLRPDIEIVARAAEEGSERKLIAAGANDVVSPYKTSGRAMARLALEHRGTIPDTGEMPAAAPSLPSQ